MKRKSHDRVTIMRLKRDERNHQFGKYILRTDLNLRTVHSACGPPVYGILTVIFQEIQ